MDRGFIPKTNVVMRDGEPLAIVTRGEDGITRYTDPEPLEPGSYSYWLEPL